MKLRVGLVVLGVLIGLATTAVLVVSNVNMAVATWGALGWLALLAFEVGWVIVLREVLVREPDNSAY